MKYFVASDIHGDSYWAQRIIDADPTCEHPENALLWQRLAALRRTNINWGVIS